VVVVGLLREAASALVGRRAADYLASELRGQLLGREVELVLEAHPAVQEVAVAGLPSDKWGEQVTAFVVPSGSAPVIESELIAFAQERLASYKCPKRVITIDKLPRNAMGKVQRSVLTATKPS